MVSRDFTFTKPRGTVAHAQPQNIICKYPCETFPHLGNVELLSYGNVELVMSFVNVELLRSIVNL